MTADGGELAERVEDWRAEHSAPGVSAAVVRGGETVFAVGAGKRRLEPEQPATPDTRYRVGSVSKPVTATTAFTLVADGDLELDDAVAEYVPAFDPPGSPVTVGEALSHTSGLPEDGFAAHLANDRMDLGIDAAFDLRDWTGFEEFLAAHRDDRRDDGRFRYCNSGYAAVGRLVAAVTGDPFPVAVRERVFEPLGMDTATFDPAVVNRHLDGDDGGADVACPYDPDEDGETFEPLPAPEAPPMAPAGGLVASVRDLAAFASGFATGEFPLGASLRGRMVDPVVETGTFLDGRTREYAHGWYRTPFGDDVLVGHPGNVDGGSGYVGVLPERGVGVAVGSNVIALGPDSAAELARELLALATGADPTAVSPGPGRQVATITGRYEATTGHDAATVTWDPEEKTLCVEVASPFGDFDHEFAPCEATPARRTFRRVGPGGELFEATFRTDCDPVELDLPPLLLRRVDDGAG